MLLERADELELAHHDFRGRPLALFASFIRRIDRLRAELIDATRYAAWAASARRRRGRARARVRRRLRRPRPDARGARRLRRGRRRSRRAVAAAARRRRRCARASPSATRRSSSTTGRTARTASASWSRRSSRAAARLTAAGDDDQAIGRARGAGAAEPARASPSSARTSPVVTLAQSFRCPQRVLDAAHAVVAPLAPRIGKDVRGGAGGEVRFWRAANERAQAQRVAAELERLIGREGVAPERCAVLVALGRRGGPAGRGRARRARVPCRVVGARGVLRPHRGARRARLAAPARRPARRPRGRARARAPADRAVRRADIARCVQIARRRRIDMVARARRRDRVAAARARGARAHPAVPRDRSAPPRDALDEHARRPLRAPPDRAARPAPPPALHGARRRRRAARSTSRASASSPATSAAACAGAGAREFARYVDGRSPTPAVGRGGGARAGPRARGRRDAALEDAAGPGFDHVFVLGLHAGRGRRSAPAGARADPRRARARRRSPSSRPRSARGGCSTSR